MEALFLFLNAVLGFIFGRIFRLFGLGENPFI